MTVTNQPGEDMGIPPQATLFDAIAHGDEDHRAWLKEAIDAHFAGQPVPEPRGKGNKAALIQHQQERITALEAGLREAIKALELASQCYSAMQARALLEGEGND